MTTQILLVDDHGAVREVLSVLLHRHGYRVVTANDGDEAVARLATEGFDLVITDRQHPGAGQAEICAQAKRCLVLSSSPGADVSKAASLDTLLMAIRQALI